MIANNNKPCSNCIFCEKITIGGEGTRICLCKGWKGYSLEMVLIDTLPECPYHMERTKMEMKYSEAKTIIEFERHFLCSRCYPYIEYGVSEECNFCRERKAYDLAIEALEKTDPANETFIHNNEVSDL